MLSVGRIIAILLLFVAIGMGALAGCGGQREHEVAIRFELHRGSSEGGVDLQDARLYVHGFELIDADGRAHLLRLRSHAPWQNESVALIDLIGASADDRNVVARGVMRSETRAFRGLRFSVGVPFALNHVNPLTAPPPLNRADLFWTWQTGYKFLRLDFRIDGHDSAFHLGSTGCSSASALRPPAASCAQPNVMRIELAHFDPQSHVVRVDLTGVIEALRTSDGVACTGDYANLPACAAAFSATGMNIATGQCEGDVCATQALFGAP